MGSGIQLFYQSILISTRRKSMCTLLKRKQSAGRVSHPQQEIGNIRQEHGHVNDIVEVASVSCPTYILQLEVLQAQEETAGGQAREETKADQPG